MAGVPTNFQAFSNVLANYNYVDIASGTGYVNFYAGDTVDLNLLSNFTYYSDNIAETETGTTAAGYTSLFDDDYDVVLNRPMDINGLGIVNVPFCLNNPTGTAQTGYVVVTLRKWNGAEADIVTNTSSVFTVAGGGGRLYKMLAVDLNCPLTHFKKGETMRLSINVYGKSVGGSTIYYNYAHDPMNRTTGWDATGAVPSKLMFQCPVRLNL